MKYIRTKDNRIVAIPNKSKLVLYDNEKLIIDTTKKGQTCVYGIVEKQANTIEELCDVFVLEKNDYFEYMIFKLFTSAKSLKLESVKDEEVVANIYGAIWTDKGLIYVAKMNEKGELELL